MNNNPKFDWCVAYLRDLEQALSRNNKRNMNIRAVLPCKHCNYINICDVTLLSNSETAASLFIWISVWDQSFLGRANHKAITAAINFCKYTDSAHYAICAAGHCFIAWSLRCSGLIRKRLGFGHLLNCVFLKLLSYCPTDGLKWEQYVNLTKLFCNI